MKRYIALTCLFLGCLMISTALFIGNHHLMLIGGIILILISSYDIYMFGPIYNIEVNSQEDIDYAKEQFKLFLATEPLEHLLEVKENLTNKLALDEHTDKREAKEWMLEALDEEISKR